MSFATWKVENIIQKQIILYNSSDICEKNLVIQKLYDVLLNTYSETNENRNKSISGDYYHVSYSDLFHDGLFYWQH